MGSPRAYFQFLSMNGQVAEAIPRNAARTPDDASTPPIDFEVREAAKQQGTNLGNFHHRRKATAELSKYFAGFYVHPVALPFGKHGCLKLPFDGEDGREFRQPSLEIAYLAPAFRCAKFHHQTFAMQALSARTELARGAAYSGQSGKNSWDIVNSHEMPMSVFGLVRVQRSSKSAPHC